MSAPELEHAEAFERPKRRFSVLLTIGVLLLIVGLVVSLTGAWRIFVPQPEAPKAPQQLELPEATPAGDFGKQQPKWTDCGDGFVCADVRAPLDWANESGDTITLRMVKHPAQGKALGTLFVNPGGPGASGASFVRDSLDYAVGKPLQENYDVIGWDPRGVGASSPVSCFDAKDMDEYLFSAADERLERGSKKWIDRAVKSSKEFGGACQKRTGDLLEHVDTMSTVQDLNMLREIVGDAKLNYLGFSYGTYIGARYADKYPELVGRMVLDGVLEPDATESDVVREQTRGFEQALRSYAAACLGTKDCPLTGTVDEAMSQIGALLAKVDQKPLTGSDGRSVTSSTLLTAIVTPLYAQSNWGYLNRLFEDVAKGNADIALALADSYYGRENGQYQTNSTEAFQAINCLDYPRAKLDPDKMRRDAAELEKIAPTIGRYQGYGDVSCQGWPYGGAENRGPVTGAGAAPIVVIGTTGDPATPFRWAESLADQLESGTLLRFEGEGHTAYTKDGCVKGYVDSYFVEGTVPAAGVTCVG